MKTINDFLAYVDYFSSQKYDDFYTDDVVVELRAVTLRGKPAVKAFYEAMAPLVRETIRVRHVEIDADRIVADVWSDFYALQDWPEFPIQPIAKGQMLRVPLQVTYTLRDGKFAHIVGVRQGEPVLSG
jgi:hypothetical protein